MSYEFECLDVVIEGRLAIVTINNPPINIITAALFFELIALSEQLQADPDLSVVVFKSLDPDFFIAHFDVELILSFPTDTPAARDGQLNDFQKIGERFKSMNKLTIAQIEGRVGGGGSEFVSSMDMRFGVREKTVISQMEVPLGILPGGGGTQYLVQLLGRARAMEVVVGAQDLDAATAEKWGYLNRLYSGEEIDEKVMQLARRIASYPMEAVRLAKQSVNGAQVNSTEGFAEESYLFQSLLRTDDAKNQMRKFLDGGGQTRERELEIAQLVDSITF